ncbi:AAA family ATPase [Bacteroides caecimuris]|uniref:AAA family ATPase n=5 Tax=Bacteroidales TaxID=171549 RepID=UPI0026480173|nr:AAA family ATPase [Bacteroides caecimuris]
MIKRISSIKNLGIYKDFKWDANTPDFNDKNIIYGWNYSGKTTLSRLFRILANKSELENEYKAVEFSVQLENGKNITESNQLDNSLDIVVFNSDFIKDNLHFDSAEHKIKGILFDIGEESADIREKLNNVQKQINEINEWLRQNHQYVDAFNNFENLFTSESKKIKNEHFESSIEFNKGHFKRILESIDPKSLQSHIILELTKLSEIRANALAKEPLAKIEDVVLPLSFKSIIEETALCLSSEPSLSEDDVLLEQNTELYMWSKHGKEIYEQYPDIQRCAFCGSILTNERRKFLNTYYNNEAAKLRTRINSLLQQIDNEASIVIDNVYTTYSPNDFIESCKSEFKNQVYLFGDIKIAYLNELNKCKAALIDKMDNNLFIEKKLPNIDYSVETTLAQWLSQTHEIVVKHNKTVSDFQAIKNDAINKFKKHLVAKFLCDNKYYTIKLQKDKQEIEIQKYKKNLLDKQTEQVELLSKLKSIIKGKENLNRFIQLFLNRNDISVEVAENDFFILKRGNSIANNLSEGEKTAIAFSYFMVTLESLFEENKLQDTIVFIDDPISSLDANHIAQISSLINSFFFRKDSTGKVTNCFKQLFLSTHNFEFYSFLRDANNIKRKKKVLSEDGKKEEHPSCNYYMLKRVAENNVQLIKLPKSFSNYNSEYLFLFDEICEFKDKGCPEDRSYLMPNVIRRFLEIYTLIKLPGNKDEIDNRVKLLIGDVNELKILHYFSHFTSPERITKHTELVLKIPDLVDDLFVLLRKDEVHFNSLLSGVGRNSI